MRAPRSESFAGRGPVVDELLPSPAADSDYDRTGKNVEYHCVAPVGFGRRGSAPLSLIMCQFREENRCLPPAFAR
jgi:hypothetical protein